MRLRCFGCMKSVSSEVPDETVVRAMLMCPECLEAESARFAAVLGPDKVDELSVGICTEPVREPTR